jgi:hypothetical protein
MRVWLSRYTDAAYLEPSERATFNDHSFLIFEGELIKVLVPVGTLWTDPFQEEEEKSCDGKRLV